MVKNTTGGSGHKSQARKLVSTTSSYLRLPRDEGEQFAIVVKNFGGGICSVVTMIGTSITTLQCHIRGKFRSRNKKNNLITTASLLLIGLRDWEAPNYKVCDVLEVYSSDDMQSFISMPQMMSLIQPLQLSYQSSDASTDKNSACDIDFTNDIIVPTHENEKLFTIDGNEEYDLNIDDI